MPKGEYLQYGGQAIVEGVMMRSPRYFSVACRAPNGEIVLHTEALDKTWIGKQKWLKLPFLRGTLAILDAMALGIRAMKFASNVQLDPVYQPADPGSLSGASKAAREQGEIASLLLDQPAVSKGQPSGPSKRVQEGAIGVSMFAGIALGLFVFVYLPNLLAEQARRLGVQTGMGLNFIAGMLKMVMFLGYIYAIGQVKEIGEIFKYHGAEHKAINTLEVEQELNLPNCQKQTRLHPRCGTSFAIIVLILSIIVFTFVPRYPISGGHSGSVLADVTVRFGLELLILPIVAGISYELLRIAGKFRNTSVVNTLFWPGLMTQYLTTREPNEGQIEIALSALKACVRAEEAGFVEEPRLTMEDAVETAPVT